MKPDNTKVQFSSFDGIGLEGTLLKPTSTVQASSLMIHGITADRHEWGTFDFLAQMLAEHGIASLRFDYRCHGIAKADPRLRVYASRDRKRY